MSNQGRNLVAVIVGLMMSTGAVANEPEAVPGEFLVKMKSSQVMSLYSANGYNSSLGAYVTGGIKDSGILFVKMPAIQTMSSSIQTLLNHPQVEIVEPNYIYRVVRTPNDPLLGNLWGLKNEGQNDSASRPGTAGVDVAAERAWDLTTGSDAFIIAVIDTGVDYNHPDLKENMWINTAEKDGQAGVDDDQNGYTDDIYGMNFTQASAPTSNPVDDHGHGSHCSGTIAARGDDGKGIVGVMWNARIMALKFLGADGSGSLQGAILAIDYATKNGAKIMSNSWGGGGVSELLKQAIERSHAAGALFVAAAGNDGSNNDTRPTYPANYQVPNVLTVAAIDNKGAIASFSNYGKTTVHVGAPGVNIYSSITGGRYDSWSGTSMATPHVSGVAGLLLAHEPQLTNVELKQRLIATTTPLRSLKGKTVGNGIVNAYQALTNTVAPPDMNDPVRWASVDYAFSTPHPYGRRAEITHEIEVPNANEIAIYFEKFDTERGYDKLTLFNRAGEKIGEISGSGDDSFSEIIPGNYVKLVFKSDDSVEKYGFDITKIAYR